MAVLGQAVARATGSFVEPLVAAPSRAEITVRVTRRIEEVEQVWRSLSAGAIESPGQCYDFIRHWVNNRGIAEEDQCYVVGEVDGQAVVLLPLHRKRMFGLHVYTWFPGSQVGCYAPVTDTELLAGMGASGRAKLWRAMTRKLGGADLLFLRSMPAEVGGHQGLFGQLGTSLTTETLFRAAFASWEQADSEQRSRSRRKHDRQQGDRLAALGKVEFEEVTDPAVAYQAVDVMFRQRSARFKAQNIRDPFVCDGLISFYRDALCPGSGIDVRIHTLRLDGDVVAVRYNIVHGERMFCLISSMAECERLQTGSPGKQNLLRVMQTVFDRGTRVFDMGAGFTDEKRHWCNVQVPLRQHYVALTPLGFAAGVAHRQYLALRAKAKASAGLKPRLRQLSQRIDHLLGRDKPTSDQL
ncbi:GNAT family N-acetyltransferase [Devosia rhizoryzae]|uniref:GNAT family N-acetyltransferase n=1 Tax=Devosia rhizoryzae TaxID=2774137 RepID=A0ABX7C9D2_9HYPH|nr:GNAT family N-acetyltransferase [Devosia rhizoryzae]QQR40337.1 GNAT family N-acetyltransferase [Devosia rhizoryzae]